MKSSWITSLPYLVDSTMKTIKSALIIVIFLSSCLTGCTPKKKTPLVVFAAGSLITPFKQLETSFEKANPDIDVIGEYHGSIQVIRHATDLHEEIDVIATADHALIPMLMYDQTMPGSDLSYANWYALFATNKLGIAYTDGSKYAGEITPNNWYEILSRPDVRVGFADPRFDASGYRTLMVYKLAEKEYGRPELFANMFDDKFRIPLDVQTGGEMAIIRVPEVLETLPDSRVIIRGSSIQLLALLQSGELDYAFEYESVINQHGLELIQLPASLNLGESNYNNNYANITVLLDFQRFHSVKPEFTGEQIGYGITIPSNAPHPSEAARFINYLFSTEGRKIMEVNSHSMYQPVILNNPENIPPELIVK